MCKSALAIGAASILLSLIGACGVEQNKPPQAETKPLPAAASPNPTVAVSAPAFGTIRGLVRFQGRAPVMPPIDFSSNPQCEREHPKLVREQTVVVNPNRTLRDAFVWIKSGLSQARWNPPSSPVKLDQVGCQYQPHVLAFMTNQELSVVNSDFVNHDVHIEAVKNGPWNDAEPPRSETIHKRFHTEEIWFPVSCGVHPWMRSYLAVVSHPFFAVTGSGGSFELKSVPPGQYVIEAIQEKFGHREQRISLAPNQTQVVNFVYVQ